MQPEQPEDSELFLDSHLSWFSFFALSSPNVCTLALGLLALCEPEGEVIHDGIRDLVYPSSAKQPPSKHLSTNGTDI